MRVLVAGSSGLIGSELTRQLEARGDTVVRLVRRAATSANEITWDPGIGQLDPAALTGIDAVVNLAGANIGKLPWTKKYRAELIDSRLNSTRTLVNAINDAGTRPKVFASASGSGFYGDTGQATAVETDAAGEGFLADLCVSWEAEAARVNSNVRLVLLRTGIVLAAKSGALARLLPLIRMGVGGPLGSGRQWWSWISLKDEARAIVHLLDSPSASGPFNLVAPTATTNLNLVKALAKQLGRPALLPAPAFALRAALGEAADDLLLCNQKLSGQKLAASGFDFSHADLEGALNWVLGKKR